MGAKTNLILTSDNFFDTIKFQDKTSVEQVAYMMFYVTEVALLRKDMIADIIADRIHNQFESFFQRNKGADASNYTPLTKEDVEQILESHTTWFQKVNSGIFAGSDRNPKMKNAPYRLTEAKKVDLWKVFDRDITSKIVTQNKKLFLDKTLSTIVCAICFLLASTFIVNKYCISDELVVTSIQEYAKIIHLNEYNPTKKSILFVYYVTELTKLRNEVNVNAIHDRLVELKCEMPTQDELNMLLDNTNMLHSQDPNTYSLTGIGINYAEDVVNSYIKKDVNLNLSLDTIFAFITALISLLCLTFKVSYAFGKKQ